jgi:hypothetical protein
MVCELFTNLRGVVGGKPNPVWPDHGAITGIASMNLISLFEHDLFGKPVSTFPDHAPKERHPLITCRYFVADLGAASAE